MPVFTNTLKDGSLSVSKYRDGEDGDPNQEFTFRVKLIGEDIEDGEIEYTITEAPKEKITLTYDGNGGYFDNIPGQTENDLIYKLGSSGTYELFDGEVMIPQRDGFVFGGWYTDTTYTTEWTAEDVPTGDQTVYAKWDSYILTMTSALNDSPANGSEYVKDEVADIRHTITNDGTQTITGAVVSSTATGLNQTIASIAPGETVTVDDHLTVTSAMIAADTGSYDLTTSITYDAGGNSVTKTSTLPVPVARPAKVKYAVQLYGIGEAVDENNNTMGLTFGPAVGANYINSYHSHTPSGTTTAGNEHRCIHDDDWNTIISWNNTDPQVYEQCIAEGCTHSVELSLSENLKNASFDPSYTTGDGPGMLYYELYANSNYQHIRWNPLTEGGSTSYGTNFGGWGASRIRAMLNGADELTMKTADSGYCSNASSVTFDVENYTGSNTLIAAFPQELQAAIGEQAVKYDSVYNSKTEANLKTSYDKLWLLSPNEIWTTAQNTSSYYTHPLEGTQFSRFAGNTATSSTSSQDFTKAYYIANTSGNNAGSADCWWLRSSNGNSTYGALGVFASGLVNNRNTCSRNGVAPCFSLKVSH